MKLNKKRGGILIYMLGVIVLVGMIVTEFLIETAGEIRYRGQVLAKEDLKIIGYSALQISLGVLNEIKTVDKKLYSPYQGWGNPLDYAKITFPEAYKVNITINDETGKISLYQQDQVPLDRLLRALGVDFTRVESLKSSLTKWLNESKEVAYGNLVGKKKGPKGPKASAQITDTDTLSQSEEEEKLEQAERRILNLLDLQEIEPYGEVFFDEDGRSNELFREFSKYVSIYHNEPVNINTAPSFIKDALFGSEGFGFTESTKYYRSINEFNSSAGASIQKMSVGIESVILNIGIEVTRGPVRYYLNAIVKVSEKKEANDKKNQKFNILALTDDAFILR